MWQWTAGIVAMVLLQGCGGSGVDRYVATRSRIVAMTHVRVIDGTGRPGKDDQTLIIQDGRISGLSNASDARVPPQAEILDLPGRTVIPGLVGMHEHLFYQIESSSTGTVVVAAQAAFAKLYLASGVTTIRTAGAVDFDGDLRIKRLIDIGSDPGPKIHVTGPYLNARGSAPDPDGIAREVAAQADKGATSLKAYTSLRSSELRAAIIAAHERGLRITGHLCAVGYREAASLGIDNLEHGIVMDTEFFSGKQADICPNQGAVLGEFLGMDVTDAAIQETIRELVRHGVRVTSTLAVLESYTARESIPDPRIRVLLASRMQGAFTAAHDAWSGRNSEESRAWAGVLRKEMQFERQFLASGGRLMAGADPTGWGGTMAGFADLRGLELLVEAGLTPEQAIRVATANGADFLRESETIGSVEAGKQADLVIIRGNPSVNISDVQNVELVFKDGVGYRPAALIAAAQGTVGQYDLGQLLRWPPFYLTLGLVLVLLTARLVKRRWLPRNAFGAQP
jgi:imidazolonepropionase-like amidohydrolase